MIESREAWDALSPSEQAAFVYLRDRMEEGCRELLKLRLNEILSRSCESQGISASVEQSDKEMP